MSEDSSKNTGFVAPSLEELVPLFPAYEIESFIAQGGMGAVYKATQKSLDRPVAIKILPIEFGNDPQFRASFEAEAKAMARLNHPNLISVYDFGDIEGMLYIVMEFVQGKALYYSSHKKAIDPKVAFEIVSTVCRGLGHAHRGGIIHRDIKPANILLDTDATPKIGDFGLAQPVDRNEEGGLVFGTPGYTAPEIFQEGNEVDERSDIFSVGALLYELISGKQPEKDTYSMSTGTDPRIDTIIIKATHPDPNLRHKNVDELADELDALLPKLSGPKFSTAAPVSTPAFSPPPPVLTSSKQKSGGLSFVFILLMLVGAAGATYYAFSGNDRGRPNTPANEPEKVQKPSKPDNDKRNVRNKPKPNQQKPPKRDRPKPAPDMPKPKPAPVVPDKPEETPLQALARLAPALKEGKRDEFPPETVKTENAAYFLVKQNMTWDEARNFAATHGAHLAILDSPEKLKWFHGNFKSPTPVWLGASDSGFEKGWAWDNGKEVAQSLWAPNSPDNKTDQSPNGEDFAAISKDDPVLEDRFRLEKLPVLLEWYLDGKTPASLDAQLARTGQALNAKRRPTFPSGTFNVGGSRFLLVEREVSWEDAQIIASNAGGHLAVPSNKTEAAFLSLQTRSQLKEEHSCWIGGRRSPETPAIWQFVTGEVFTFISWHETQPDNESEDRLVLKKLNGNIGASDESVTGFDTTHFFVEWSRPSMRNMPTTTGFDERESELLKALEEVRDKVRGRYGRNYRKYKKKRDDIIEDFVENTITEINNTERLAAPIKARLVEGVKKYIDENRLPDNLPPMTPPKIKRDLEKAQKELKELDEENGPDFEEAKEAYLKELLETANSVVKKGEETKAKMLILENTVTEGDDERFKRILRGEKVPLPEEPKEEEEDEGDDDE